MFPSQAPVERLEHARRVRVRTPSPAEAQRAADERAVLLQTVPYCTPQPGSENGFRVRVRKSRSGPVVQLQDTGKGNGLLASAGLLVDIGHTIVACECDNDLAFRTKTLEEVVAEEEARRVEAAVALVSAKV